MELSQINISATHQSGGLQNIQVVEIKPGDIKVKQTKVDAPQESPFGLSGIYGLHSELSEKVKGAIKSLRMSYQEGREPVLMCSFGKDSSILLELACIALQQEVESGNTNAKLIVATSLVGGSENPVMSLFVQEQIENLKSFTEKTGLPIQVETVTPNLSENFLLNMLGGRAFASFPGQDSTCSAQLKVSPLSRLKKQVTSNNSCTLLGTYYQESAERQQKMIERGDRPDEIRTTDGQDFLSPMAHFTADDVFSLVSSLSIGDFGIPVSLPDGTQAASALKYGRIMEVYLSANGGTCTTDAFNDGKASSQGCGGRFGCHNCVKVKSDKSLQNMIEEEDYKWMKIFSDIRECISATQYDLSKRTWLSKKVNNNGELKIEPGSFSPDFMKDLLRYYLTAKAETGYDVISDKELIWVAMQWGRYGVANPIEAIEIWRDINIDGKRFYPPEKPTHYSAFKIPKGQWFPVNDGLLDVFGEGHQDTLVENVTFDYSQKDLFVEIVNAIEELSEEGVDSCLQLALQGQRATKNPDTHPFNSPEKEVLYQKAVKLAKKTIRKDTKAIQKDKEVVIDEDGLQDFLWITSKDMVNGFKEKRGAMSPSEGFHQIVRHGVIRFPKSQNTNNERMLQRSNLIWRQGLMDKLNHPTQILEQLESIPSGPGVDLAKKCHPNDVCNIDISGYTELNQIMNNNPDLLGVMQCLDDISAPHSDYAELLAHAKDLGTQENQDMNNQEQPSMTL